MAFAREIIHTILENVRFRVPTTEEKDSYYTSIGNVLIRISNHCTRLYVWDDILEKNPRYKGLPIISIVFEDEGNTFNEEECLTLKRYRMKPIKVAEHVFPIHGNGQYINKEDINKIIASIKEIGTSQKFNDRTGKSQYFPRISKNPSNASINPDNNQIKENQNNMKKTIRLTESDLSNIIMKTINEFTLREPEDDVRKILPLLKEAYQLLRKAMSQLNGEHTIDMSISKEVYGSEIDGEFRYGGGIQVDGEYV